MLNVIIGRMIRAARLEPQLYEEVEHDVNATQEAAIVVGIVAVCGFISALFSLVFAAALVGAFGGVAPTTSFIGLLIGGLIGPFINWIVFAYVAFFVGTRMFGGTATPGELLRTMGYAQSPAVLGILTFIPCLGWILALVLLVWVVAAAVIAMRQALDITTGNAILTGIISFVIVLVIRAIFALIGLGI